jgi:hypothetical protein
MAAPVRVASNAVCASSFRVGSRASCFMMTSRSLSIASICHNAKVCSSGMRTVCQKAVIGLLPNLNSEQGWRSGK